MTAPSSTRRTHAGKITDGGCAEIVECGPRDQYLQGGTAGRRAPEQSPAGHRRAGQADLYPIRAMPDMREREMNDIEKQYAAAVQKSKTWYLTLFKKKGRLIGKVIWSGLKGAEPWGNLRKKQNRPYLSHIRRNLHRNDTVEIFFRARAKKVNRPRCPLCNNLIRETQGRGQAK